MQFKLNDLIKVIGRKYGLELNDEVLDNLAKSNTDTLPKEFLEEINNIVIPLLEIQKSSGTFFDSKEEFYKLVPKEYIDQINPIDNDGKKVLSMSELRRAVQRQRDISEPLNSNEKVNEYREKLKASYVHGDYPVMAELEHAWRLLEKDYKYINREEHPAGDPISSLNFYLDVGCYPPPEIMMVLGDALNLYFVGAGYFSLDEILFGRKHKKTSSLAYKKNKKFKYQFFDFQVNLNRQKEGNSSQSLEAIMLKILEETNPVTMVVLGFDPEVDIDTFLRGYRRWKQDMKEGKYE